MDHDLVQNADFDLHTSTAIKCVPAGIVGFLRRFPNNFPFFVTPVRIEQGTFSFFSLSRNV